jgi:hypothetical protein
MAQIHFLENVLFPHFDHPSKEKGLQICFYEDSYSPSHKQFVGSYIHSPDFFADAILEILTFFRLSHSFSRQKTLSKINCKTTQNNTKQHNNSNSNNNNINTKLSENATLDSAHQARYHMLLCSQGYF